MLFSFFSVANTVGEPIALTLMDIFSWTTINLIGLLYEIIFLFLAYKYFIKIEELPIEKLSPNY